MSQRLILIVEDDPALGDTVVEVLQLFDFAAELICDGALAFTRIVTQQPDLVLLDIHLPGMSGLEILNQIRADERLANTKVVMVTADALRAQSVIDKADFVLLKPYTISQLSELVIRLIGNKTSTS